MSQAEPKGIYVYQPFGVNTHRGDRIYGIGGLPLGTTVDGLTRGEADAVLHALTKEEEFRAPVAARIAGLPDQEHHACSVRYWRGLAAIYEDAYITAQRELDRTRTPVQPNARAGEECGAPCEEHDDCDRPCARLSDHDGRHGCKNHGGQDREISNESEKSPAQDTEAIGLARRVVDLLGRCTVYGPSDALRDTAARLLTLLVDAEAR